MRTPATWDMISPWVDSAEAGTASFALERGVTREDPDLVLAIGLRETWLGTVPDFRPRLCPEGVGDGGHGHGFFQVDDRGPYRRLIRPAPWPIVVQVMAVTEVLRDNRREMGAFLGSPRFLQAVVCAYNASPAHVVALMTAGKDPDEATTGADYGSDVLRLQAVVKQLRRENP